MSSAYLPVPVDLDVDVDLTALPSESIDPRGAGWWGVVVAILTEATHFAALLAAYFYVRLNSPSWPIQPIEPPRLLLPTIGLAVLLLSSGSAWMATRAMGRDERSRAGALLGVTVVLGVMFLVLQFIDFQDTDYGVATNAGGTLHYTILGVHTAHVIVGIIFLAFATWRCLARTRRAPKTVEAISLYWHFVDAVWIVVWLSLIVSEHWS